MCGCSIYASVASAELILQFQCCLAGVVKTYKFKPYVRVCCRVSYRVLPALLLQLYAGMPCIPVHNILLFLLIKDLLMQDNSKQGHS